VGFRQAHINSNQASNEIIEVDKSDIEESVSS